MKSIYFLSDAHLGSWAIQHRRMQERRLVRFLDSIKDKAAAVYLLGDMFDFWYEFKYVVPKGYTRFLGKLSELTDMGVEVHFSLATMISGHTNTWRRNVASFCISSRSPWNSTTRCSSWPTATDWATPTISSRCCAGSSTASYASLPSLPCIHDGASGSDTPGPSTHE